MAPLPLQVTFRDMDPSDSVRARIEKRARKLRLFHPRVESCRVVVRAPHQHKHHGRLYNVRIDLKVPRRAIVINRASSARQSHADIYVAVRDAFNALDRRLEDVARRGRGEMKRHSLHVEDRPERQR
ncbi:MAG: ribosome-associated translation inhibitor RaiA [Alphaproteobacteria bacterium]|nr:ribosome-associated translation inhibitor RaiA [Alphaproteobacteria bacterium]